METVKMLLIIRVVELKVAYKVLVRIEAGVTV